MSRAPCKHDPATSAAAGAPWMPHEGEPGLVSVVAPTYERAHLIADVMHSVRAQTYRPIELLIVDDGSTDDTEAVVRAWQDEYADPGALAVRYLHQENSGAPAARNRGLAASKGTFIQYLDSDDVLHPQKLALHVAALREHPEWDYVWSDWDWAQLRDFVPYTDRHASEYDAERLCADAAVRQAEQASDLPSSVWSGLYRRAWCRRIGPWNEAVAVWQDVEYNGRFSALGPRYAHLDAALYHMRAHGGERVGDHKRGGDGVAPALASLREIERTATRAEANTEQWTDLLRGFYFKVVHRALRWGTSEQAKTALEGAARYGRDPSFRRKVRLLQGLHRLFGQRVAYLCYRTYSRIAAWRAG